MAMQSRHYQRSSTAWRLCQPLPLRVSLAVLQVTYF